MSELLVGSLAYTVLLYVVSEPGTWTIQDIVDDLPGASPADVSDTIATLLSAELLHSNSTDGRLWPLRAGKQAFRSAG